jgi:hypothetical protein
MARLAPLLAPLSALLLLGAAGQAAARTPFQERCEARQLGLDTDSRPTGIRIESHGESPGGYRVDSSLSYRSLTRMKRERAGDFVLGLTRAESRVAISLEGAIVSDPATGEECLLPQIGVSLSYLPIVIYIGSEFDAGSCAYREILAHEMRHLKAYVDYLPKVESRVRATMGRRFDARPVYAPHGQALARVQAELDGRWMPFIKHEMGKAKALQARIDSPGEYARLSKLCQGEVQSLIGSTRHARLTSSS